MTDEELQDFQRAMREANDSEAEAMRVHLQQAVAYTRSLLGWPPETWRLPMDEVMKKWPELVEEWLSSPVLPRVVQVTKRPLDVVAGIWLSRLLAGVSLVLFGHFVVSHGGVRPWTFLLCSGSFFLASKVFEEMDDA